MSSEVDEEEEEDQESKREESGSSREDWMRSSVEGEAICVCRLKDQHRVRGRGERQGVRRTRFAVSRLRRT